MPEQVLDPEACSAEAPRPCEVATGMGFMARLLELEGLDPSFLLVNDVTEGQACRLMQQAIQRLRGRPDGLQMAQEVFALTFPKGCPGEPEA